MGALVVAAKLTTPLNGKKIEEAGILAMPAVTGVLRTALADLIHAIDNRPAPAF